MFELILDRDVEAADWKIEGNVVYEEEDWF